jgi:sigma-B regulation protein RsbU (phosphoserine phosphatase)
LQRREFVAMVYAHLDLREGRVTIANAGMPDPLVISANGCRAVTFTGDRFPLGARAASRYASTSLTLADGDRLLLFSDGLPEALVDGEPLGYDRVESLAAAAPDASSIVDALLAIEGVQVDDDVTVVVISRAP